MEQKEKNKVEDYYLPFEVAAILGLAILIVIGLIGTIMFPKFFISAIITIILFSTVFLTLRQMDKERNK